MAEKMKNAVTWLIFFCVVLPWALTIELLMRCAERRRR